MSTVKTTAEIDRPVSEVYDRWTRFEEFPAFMEGVEEVRQLDAKTIEWRVSIAGVDREFRTEIVEQEARRRRVGRSPAATGSLAAMAGVALHPASTRSEPR